MPLRLPKRHGREIISSEPVRQDSLPGGRNLNLAASGLSRVSLLGNQSQRISCYRIRCRPVDESREQSTISVVVSRLCRFSADMAACRLIGSSFREHPFAEVFRRKSRERLPRTPQPQYVRRSASRRDSRRDRRVCSVRPANRVHECRRGRSVEVP